MSKVYEALRQKEQETNELLSTYANAEEGSAAGAQPRVGPDSELGITDRVLQAAVTDSDEEHTLGNQSVSPLYPSTEQVRAPQGADDGFRRLILSTREDSRLIFLTDPHGLAAEQFRFLRRTLEQKFPNGAVLLITSPAARDGKTLTALNLCACLAESGRSALLLEADTRQPSVRKILGTPNAGAGVEDALAGNVEPGQAVCFVDQLSLYVAMVVEPPSDPSRLINGSGAERFLAWARENFDWIVIDSPPVLPAADVAKLATLADGVLLVVRAQNTPRDLTARALEMLRDHLYGVLLNEATIESNPHYRYLADYHQRSDAPGRQEVTAGSS